MYSGHAVGNGMRSHGMENDRDEPICHHYHTPKSYRFAEIYIHIYISRDITRDTQQILQPINKVGRLL